MKLTHPRLAVVVETFKKLEGLRCSTARIVELDRDENGVWGIFLWTLLDGALILSAGNN